MVAIALGDVAAAVSFPLTYVVAAAGLFTFVSGIVYVRNGVRQLQTEGHANAQID